MDKRQKRQLVTAKNTLERAITGKLTEQLKRLRGVEAITAAKVVAGDVAALKIVVRRLDRIAGATSAAITADAIEAALADVPKEPVPLIEWAPYATLLDGLGIKHGLRTAYEPVNVALRNLRLLQAQLEGEHDPAPAAETVMPPTPAAPGSDTILVSASTLSQQAPNDDLIDSFDF